MNSVHIHIEKIAVVLHFNRNPPVLFSSGNQRLIPPKSVFQIQVNYNIFIARLIF